jgi:plastocyanin domain-containing protein
MQMHRSWPSNKGRDGYSPDNLKVKAGPVKLIVNSESQYSCASQFQIPSKNIPTTNLKKGKNEFTFIAKAGETIDFMCGMAMYKGKIEVSN